MSKPEAKTPVAPATPIPNPKAFTGIKRVEVKVLKPGAFNQTKRIARVFVIDSDVAFYGSVPLEAVSPELHPLCIACSTFLARAAFHGAELHVPSVFLSNVASLAYRDLVTSEIVTLEGGKIVLEAILGTHWEIHFPVWNDVFDIQHALKRTNSTSIAEFLSVASNLGCAFISTNMMLLEEIGRSKIRVSTMMLTDHVWSRLGALEDHPPD
jgi:hypothetical protein